MSAGGAWRLGAVVVLAAWLGASLLTAAVVAPAAFAVLPTRTLAGALVGRVLPVIFVSGLAAGAVFGTRALLGGGAAPHARVRGIAALALALACALAQFVVAPRIERTRAAIAAPLETLSPDDPRRAAFGRLHGLSVLCLGAGMLAAAVALGYSAAGLARLGSAGGNQRPAGGVRQGLLSTGPASPVSR